MFLEADFLREYQLDLATDIDRLTWRKFLVLLRGLSPQSATVTSMQSRQVLGKKRPRVNEVAGPKAAQQAFDALFKPPPRTG